MSKDTPKAVIIMGPKEQVIGDLIRSTGLPEAPKSPQIFAQELAGWVYCGQNDWESDFKK